MPPVTAYHIMSLQAQLGRSKQPQTPKVKYQSESKFHTYIICTTMLLFIMAHTSQPILKGIFISAYNKATKEQFTLLSSKDKIYDNHAKQC